MLRDILTKKKLLFDHDTPEDFVRSLWQKQPRISLVWIIYRFAVVLYLIGDLITICVHPTPGYVCKKNMIYFTHWSYVGEILAYVCSCANCVERYVQQKKDPELPPMEKMPVMYKVFWCVYGTCTASTLGVTVMFWIFAYNPDDYETVIYTFSNYVVNPLIIVIDFFVSATPFRFLHIYLPMSFTIIYLIFSIIYQLSGGTGNKGEIPIYKILDWRDPKIATSAGAVSLGCVTIMHGALGLFNMVRQFLKNMRDRGVERDNVFEDET